jgi:hypothetical protein
MGGGTPMIPELRDGLPNAGIEHRVPPDGTEVWADGVEEIIPVVALMLEAAIARHLPVSGR